MKIIICHIHKQNLPNKTVVQLHDIRAASNIKIQIFLMITTWNFMISMNGNVNKPGG